MILALGPYVGDFENEILIFRPYMKWITKVIRSKMVYISTHFNRAFLYDWIPEENVLPVYKEFSRNEMLQIKYIHENISSNDYTLLLRQFKNDIQSNHPSEKIESYHLSYSKSGKVYYSMYKRDFSRVKLQEDSIEEKDYIAYIPDSRFGLDEVEQVYDLLIQRYNILVIGDMRTHLTKKNVVLQNTDYIENGYKYIIEYINKANAVICPLGHWAALTNLQGTPLFTWGPYPGSYKEEGTYSFGNHQCVAIPATEETSSQKIVDSFSYFYDKIER